MRMGPQVVAPLEHGTEPWQMNEVSIRKMLCDSQAGIKMRTFNYKYSYPITLDPGNIRSLSSLWMAWRMVSSTALKWNAFSQVGIADVAAGRERTPTPSACSGMDKVTVFIYYQPPFGLSGFTIHFSLCSIRWTPSILTNPNPSLTLPPSRDAKFRQAHLKLVFNGCHEHSAVALSASRGSSGNQW